MQAITVSRRVAAPVDDVWAVLTDIAHAADTIQAIESVELHTGEQFAVGTRWTGVRTMMGRTARETMEVTAVDPGRSYVVEAANGATRYRSEFLLTPDGDGTRLTMTFAGETHSVIGRVLAATLGKLFVGATRKALEADLVDIAHASEHRAERDR